jgi:2-dehydro-3-deoxyphosphogluconate aldolase/(4S)-4-hydroxy-2-oxoglutarate aldolase
VLDKETAERCLDAGATFITSTGLVMEVMEVTLGRGVVAIPGALTPTEVIAAWKSGADFVKVFPAASLGADLYIRSLKQPLPQVQFAKTETDVYTKYLTLPVDAHVRICAGGDP